MRSLRPALAAALLSLGSCDAIWSASRMVNSENCVANPGCCAADQKCDPATEQCVPIPPGPPPGPLVPIVCGTATWAQPGGLPLFAAPVVLATATRPSIAVHNFDGDNRPDVALSDQSDDSVRLLRNDASGGFEAPRLLAQGLRPEQLLGADLNGDGTADLATVNYVGSSISLLRRDGSGSFVAQPELTVPSSPHFLKAGDVDRDGRMDLVAATDSMQSLFLWRSSGDFSFRAVQTISLSGALAPSGLLLAALRPNQRRDVDVIVLGADDTLSVLLGSGDGTFSALPRMPLSGYPSAVAAGNIDADALVDLAVVLRSAGEAAILEGRGDGKFAPPVRIPVGNQPEDVLLVDLNGDKTLDLVVANHEGTGAVQVYQGVPRAATTMRTRVDLPSVPLQLAAGDFDCDGRVDLIAATADQVLLLRNVSP